MKHLATLVVLCVLLATATAVFASGVMAGDSSNLVCATQGLNTTTSSSTVVGVSPVVPEPSSILAFCVGIVGLAGVCRRRH